MIRIQLPAHLRTLAGVNPPNGEIPLEVQIDAEGNMTLRTVLDALESQYPMLRGTIRDRVTLERRAFLRFFACGTDLSHQSADAPLPGPVATGDEILIVLGAIAGG